MCLSLVSLFDSIFLGVNLDFRALLTDVENALGPASEPLLGLLEEFVLPSETVPATATIDCSALRSVHSALVGVLLSRFTDFGCFGRVEALGSATAPSVLIVALMPSMTTFASPIVDECHYENFFLLNPALEQLSIHCSKLFRRDLNIGFLRKRQLSISLVVNSPILEATYGLYRPSGVAVLDNAALESLEFPNLVHVVQGSFWVSFNNKLTNLTFAALKYVDCDFDITQNKLSGAVPTLPIYNYDGIRCKQLNDEYGTGNNIQKRAVYTISRQCHVQTNSDSNCFTALANCNFVRVVEVAPSPLYTDNGCDCVTKDVVCPLAVAGPAGLRGPRGPIGKPAESANAPLASFDNLVCTKTFAGTSAASASLVIANGTCAFRGGVASATNGHGARVRVAVTVAYKRVDSHVVVASEKFAAVDRCGPSVVLSINGNIVYKNSDVIFAPSGLISGAVELDMPDSLYNVALHIIADAHCANGARLVLGNEVVDVTIINKKPVANFLVPALLN